MTMDSVSGQARRFVEPVGWVQIPYHGPFLMEIPMFILELFPEVVEAIKAMPEDQQPEMIREFEDIFEQELQKEINLEILSKIQNAK